MFLRWWQNERQGGFFNVWVLGGQVEPPTVKQTTLLHPSVTCSTLILPLISSTQINFIGVVIVGSGSRVISFSLHRRPAATTGRSHFSPPLFSSNELLYQVGRSAGLGTPHQHAAADSDERAVRPSDHSSLTAERGPLIKASVAAPCLLMPVSLLAPPSNFISPAADEPPCRTCICGAAQRSGDVSTCCWDVL